MVEDDQIDEPRYAMGIHSATEVVPVDHNPDLAEHK